MFYCCACCCLVLSCRVLSGSALSCPACPVLSCLKAQQARRDGGAPEAAQSVNRGKLQIYHSPARLSPSKVSRRANLQVKPLRCRREQPGRSLTRASRRADKMHCRLSRRSPARPSVWLSARVIVCVSHCHLRRSRLRAVFGCSANNRLGIRIGFTLNVRRNLTTADVIMVFANTLRAADIVQPSACRTVVTVPSQCPSAL